MCGAHQAVAFADDREARSLRQAAARDRADAARQELQRVVRSPRRAEERYRLCMEVDSSEPVKPRLRGVFHEYAFFVSIACGITLILAAPDRRARLAAAIYAVAVSGLLGTSALYHRVTWRPQARRWMRRLDHSMIFVLIAGTYTPVALLALKGSLASVILIVLWVGALGGVVFKLLWIDAGRSRIGKWLFAGVYVVLGLVSAAVFGELPAAIGWLGVAGLATGGLLYVVGAIVYASGRPNPWPKVFGYHEVFHTLVLAAAGLQYSVIAFAVLPRG
jgi:hemolysin III